MAPRARAVLRWIAALGLAALVLAASAAALSPIPPRLGEVAGVRLAVDASGRAVAVWEQAVDEPGRFRVRVAERGHAGWAPPRTLTPAGESVSGLDMAGNAAGEVVAAWQRDPGGGSPIRAVARSAAGAWSDPVDLASSGSLASRPRIGLGADGTAVVAWGLVDGTVAAAVRRPGEAWGPMRIVSGPSAPQPAWAAPAVAADGSALIAWASGPPGQRTVHVAELAVGGTGAFAAPRPISAPADVRTTPAVATGADGAALVAWRRTLPDGFSAETVVAERTPAGAWGGETVLAAPEAIMLPIPAAHAAGQESPSAAIDAAGRALVVWSDPVGDLAQGLGTIRAALRPAGGAWAAAQTLAGPGPFGSARLLAGAGGATFALWRDRSQLIGAAAAPGAGFGEPADLTPADDGASGGAQVGVDGAGGLVAAWRALSSEDVSVRASTRPAAGAWSPPQDISREITLQKPDPGDSVTPPTVGPEPIGEERRPPRRAGRPDRVALSPRQLRINQRIAQAALRRVRALEARLAGRPVPRRLRGRAGVVRLTRAQLVVNQRIAQTALRRVARLEARVEGRRLPAARPRSERRRIVLTARQLLIDQRIAQAALRRVAALEEGLTGR